MILTIQNAFQTFCSVSIHTHSSGNGYKLPHQFCCNFAHPCYNFAHPLFGMNKPSLHIVVCLDSYVQVICQCSTLLFHFHSHARTHTRASAAHSRTHITYTVLHTKWHKDRALSWRRGLGLKGCSSFGMWSTYEQIKSGNKTFSVQSAKLICIRIGVSEIVTMSDAGLYTTKKVIYSLFSDFLFRVTRFE